MILKQNRYKIKPYQRTGGKENERFEEDCQSHSSAVSGIAAWTGSTGFISDKRTFLTLGITTGVELSYLSKDAQKLIWAAIDYEQTVPNKAQAMKIRNLAEKGKLDFDILEEILTEEKGNQHDRIFFNKQKIESVLPPELLKRDKRYIEDYIIEAIKKYR